MSEKGWVTRLGGKNRVEILEKPVPDVKDDGMLVEVGLAGVCGTDIHIIENADRPEWSGGLPFTLGHEVCGRVAKMGKKAVGQCEDYHADHRTKPTSNLLGRVS